MKDTPRADSPTVRAHKRQFLWQILAPLLVVVVLVIAAAVVVVSGGVSGIRTWADVSIIWIIAPFLIFALLFVVILSFLIYGFAKLLQITPRYTVKAQFYVATAASMARKIADSAVKPVIWMKQAGAVIRAIFKK